jgi:TolB protein
MTNFLEDKLPTWSFDGSAILFFSRRAGNRASQLYQTSPDADFRQNSVRMLSEGQYPSWGANNQVVFKGWGQTGSGLRLASPDLANSQPVTDSDQDSAPALAPNGKQIAFMSRRDGNWEIYRVNSDGSNLQRLTTDPADDGLPTWSPDGQAIAFVSNRNGAWVIWVISAAGNDLKKVLTMAGSPDGVVSTDPANSTGWLEERIGWAP